MPARTHTSVKPIQLSAIMLGPLLSKARPPLHLLMPCMPSWQVVGEKEKAEKLVNVRTRDQQRHGMQALPDVIAQLRQERDERHLTSTFGEHFKDPSQKQEAPVDATAAQAAASSFNAADRLQAVAAEAAKP